MRSAYDEYGHVLMDALDALIEVLPDYAQNPISGVCIVESATKRITELEAENARLRQGIESHKASKDALSKRYGNLCEQNAELVEALRAAARHYRCTGWQEEQEAAEELLAKYPEVKP